MIISCNIKVYLISLLVVVGIVGSAVCGGSVVVDGGVIGDTVAR